MDAVALAPDPGRVVHEGELGAEDPRLLVGALGQPAAADAARKAEVVADQRARGRLPADPAVVDDQRPEALRGAVDRRREAGRPGADDDDVELAPLGVDRGAGGARQLQLGRVGENGAVREDDQGQRLSVARFRDQRAPVGRVGEQERVRHRAAAEDLFQLVGPAGPGLADDVDGVRRDPPRVGPLEQEGRDGLVEELVRRSARAGSRSTRSAAAPSPRRSPRRCWPSPQLPHSISSPRWACGWRSRTLPSSSLPVVPPEPLRGEDQRDVLARGRERLELRHRLLRRGDADDAVAPLVAVDQLALDVAQRTLVFVDGEEDGNGHGRKNTAPARRGPPSNLAALRGSYRPRACSRFDW